MADGFITHENEDEGEEAQYHFVDLAIGRIRYVRHGETGDALLLIHGFGGDLDNWLLNIDAFGDDVVVYALDLPGHGHSVKAMPLPPVEGLARVVLEFMDRLGIEKAHLVGHSLGGLIAMLVARQRPERVQSLTLIAAAGLGEALNNDFILGFIAAHSREELEANLAQVFVDPRQLSRPMIDELVRYKRGEGVDEALRVLYADIVAGDVQKRVMAGELSPLAMPVLAIAGKLDRVIPAGQTFALKPDVKVHIVPQAGHMVQMEKYKTVNELIRGQIVATRSLHGRP